MKFEISFERNGVYQANIYEAPNEATARAYFEERKPDAAIIGIGEHRGTIKPGMPVVVVPDGWKAAEPFPMLAQAIEAEAVERERVRRFYIENGYCPTWAEEHRQNPDKGLQKYSTPAKWEAYKAGTLSREKAVEIAVKRGAREIIKWQEKQLEKLRVAAAAPDLANINITVEWRRNRTWGANPTADVRTVVGCFTGHASGCGYDKQSAAVANALNQSPAVCKILYTLAEKALQSEQAPKRFDNGVIYWDDLLGYGSGHSILPYFEGGVGVSCFWSIFKNAGFETRNSGSGKMFDCYTVSRAEG